MLGTLRGQLLPLTRNAKFMRLDYNNCQTSLGAALDSRHSKGNAE